MISQRKKPLKCQMNTKVQCAYNRTTHTKVKTYPVLFFKEKYSSLNTKHELKTSEEQLLLPWSTFN